MAKGGGRKKSKSKRPKGGRASVGGAETQGPRQQSLEGTEDECIQKLVDLGQEMYEVRGERMALTTREHNLQEKILKEMKRHEKQTYVYGDLTIERVVEEEKVRVRRKKPKTESDPAPASG